MQTVSQAPLMTILTGWVGSGLSTCPATSGSGCVRPMPLSIQCWWWPRGPWPNSEIQNRVMRGGSFLDDVSFEGHLRAANRCWATEGFVSMNVGFRCARPFWPRSLFGPLSMPSA